MHSQQKPLSAGEAVRPAVHSDQSEEQHSQMRPAGRRFALLGLSVVALIGLLVPSYFALMVYPIGEGPDESSHYDHAAFKFKNGLQTIRARESFYMPGMAPLGQAHQPPLYYWMGAAIYSLFLDREELGAFIDYQAGISHHPDGYFLGGDTRCTWVHDSTRAAAAPETPKVQRALYAYRISSAVLFVLGIICAFAVMRIVAPDRPILALSAAALHAAIPTAVWRSGYINNDNLTITLCSAAVLLAVIYLKREKAGQPGLALLMGAASGAAFLAKYNGIAALGICGAAILLKARQPFSRKLLDGSLAAALFAVIAAPDVWENYRIDGDPLSSQLVIETVPFLYKPTSYAAILTNAPYWQELLKRAWLNFNNFARLDLTFPLYVFSVWLGLCAAAASAGLLFFFLPQRYRAADRRTMLLFWLSCIGAAAVWMHLAKSFPIADGRYVHTALVPFCAGAVLAFSAMLAMFGRWTDWLLLGGVLAFGAFGYYHMLSYLPFLWKDCINSGAQFVPGGADMTALDINADGQDELLLYYRAPQHGYVAELREGDFEVVPEYTRRYSFSAHELLSGDINGDSKDNPIFWRPDTGGVAYVDGRDIAGHNKKYSPFSYAAGLPNFLSLQEFRGYRLLTADLNGDGPDDFIFVPPGGDVVQVLHPEKIHGRYSNRTKRTELTLPFTGQFGILKLGGSPHPAVWQPGRLAVLPPPGSGGEVRELTFPRFNNWLALDLRGDGSDDLLFWNEGDACAQPVLSTGRGDALEWLLQDSLLCIDRFGLRFGRGIIARPLRMKDGSEQLAVFDRRSGLVYFSKLNDGGELSTTSFNPGW